MNERQIYETLTEIFHDVFMRDDIELSAGLTAADIAEWDSFKHIEIIVALEERYGIKFHTRDLDQLDTVGDLVKAVLAKSPACSTGDH